MDFNPAPEALALREELEAFLSANLSPELVANVRRSGNSQLDWDFHRALAREGWLTVSIPTDFGGQGRGPLEMIEFNETLARNDAPISIRPTMFVLFTLLKLGNQYQRDELIPAVLKGDVVICLGYSEPGSGSDVAAAKTRAVRDGDQWIINGQKMFTTYAAEANYVYLLTRTSSQGSKHKGLTLFLIPLETPGIEIKPIETLSGELTNIVFYTDVHVPDHCRVGEVDEGWSVLGVSLAFERWLGRRNEVTDILQSAIRVAAETYDADGARLIDDPMVRHRLAEAAIKEEVSNLLNIRAAWLSGTGAVPGVEGSMAKLYLSEAFTSVASDLLDTFGEFSLLQYGDQAALAEGAFELAFRHSAVSTIYGGTSEVQRGIIAERGLGLPRGRPSVRSGAAVRP